MGGGAYGRREGTRRVAWGDAHTHQVTHHGSWGVTAPVAVARRVGAVAILDPRERGGVQRDTASGAARGTGEGGERRVAAEANRGGTGTLGDSPKHWTNTVVRPAPQHARQQGCV